MAALAGIIHWVDIEPVFAVVIERRERQSLVSLGVVDFRGWFVIVR